MAHLVLIDGHHLMYRAYWAIPRTMRTSSGTQTNAVFGVASMILQILKTERPDSLLFCFDEGEETFRHQEYQEYKAGRAETPDEFFEQIPLIFTLIDAFGFQRVSHRGYEADDLLCAYAKAVSKQHDQVTIVTGDRDAFQLVDGNVRVAIPAKGYQVPEYLTSDKVFEKYGVTPEQIPAYKGLVGDASDNLKGVNGIGPKAAAALLQKYPTLENLYDNVDEIKPSWKEKLLANKESAFFCRRMAQLVCDFDLPVPLESLKLQGLDPAPVLELFKEFEFSLIAKRFVQFLQFDYARAHFVSLPTNLIASSKTAPQARNESTQLSLL